MLCAKADGTKLKPMVIFKGKRVNYPEFENIKVQVAFQENADMNEDLFENWLLNVVGKFFFRKRLIILDNFLLIKQCKFENPQGDELYSSLYPSGL